MSEQVLDAENWKIEAEAVLKDVQQHVQAITVSNGTDKCIHFNVTTIEGKDYYIELSGSGFRVVGTSYDQKTTDSDDYFETPYSLLNHISPAFHKSFGNELLAKLTELKNS